MKGGSLLHALAFQAVWFACVLGAAAGSAWPGVVAAAVFLGVTLATSPCRQAEVRFVLHAALLGTALDSLLAMCGVLRFVAHAFFWPEHLAPLWLTALWASFATLASRSLCWLQGRLRLAALLGALAGPLTYASALHLEAATLQVPLPLAGVAVALEYALALPLILLLSRRLAPAAEAPDAPSETAGSPRE